jgi:outer membrane protein assembly factor BamB/PKD repeat protein
MMKTDRKITFLLFFSLIIPLLVFPSSLWANDGNKKWSFKTGGGIIASPAIGRTGTIYIGSTDHKIYAINPDGSLVWHFSGSTAGITSSPAIGPDGIIYVGSYDYHLYAIHADGTQKWAFNTGGQVNSSPAIGSDGTIYVGSGGSGSNFKLHAINPDGSAKWAFDCPVAWSSPAIGLDGTIYIGSTDGNLYAIYPDGSLKWKFSAGDFIYASPAIGNDETIYIGANNGKLYAITPAGTQKWIFETGNVNFNSFFSPTIGTDGTIYAGSNYPNNRLYALNPDGTLKWTFDTGEVFLSTPAISAEGTIYVGSKLRKLFALNPDGTLKWEFETQGFVESSPVIGTDGTVYIGSTDTYLYAIHGAPGGPAVSSWPMYRGNIHHTGCPDSDNDGLFDYWETYYFLDLSQGSLDDFDHDGLRNLLEFQMGLNPADSDADNDGMSDGWEVTHSFDPLNENDAGQDADGDGISNLDEYLKGFNPHIEAPEVQFSVEPASGLAPLTVSFQVVSTGEITGWNWDFGDGASSNEQSPTHTYFQTGTFTIDLNVVGPGGADAFSASAESINTAPVADAGPDQTVAEGAPVILNGMGSSDPDDGIDSYQWIQIAGTTITLSGSTTLHPNFTAPDVGPNGEALIFQLTVTDNGGLKSTDTCIVNVSWSNLPPVADAGQNQTVAEGALVILNGLGSSDPDDGLDSYLWTQIAGNPVPLSDPTAAYPSFTAPDVGPNGEALIFQLTVTDKGGLKSTDTCLVNISWTNLPPLADAGADQMVSEGSQVVLSGIDSSDPDDGISSYYWTQTFGTPVFFSDPTSVYPSFVAPAVGPDGEILRFQLTITDIGGLKSTDACIVKVAWVNLSPVADAGPDQTVGEGLPVTLNGTNSYDPDNEAVSYNWRQIGGPGVRIAGFDTAQATITAPDVDSDGIYLEFELRVTDIHGLSAVDQAFVNVTWSNEPPLADAGANIIVSRTDLIRLDGSNSYDREGIDIYFWEQISGPEAAISDSTAVAPTITLADTNLRDASLVFELTVTDTGGLKATDTVIVNIISDNLPPKANAGLNRNVSPYEKVTLDGLNSQDPDGDIAFYEWKQIKGPPVILSQPDFVRPTFIAPEVSIGGVALKFELTISDRSGLQDNDTVTVNVINANSPPLAIARTEVSDETITLIGTDSNDPNGYIAQYRWRQLRGPRVILSDPLNANPTFSVGESLSGCAFLEFELTVNDDSGLSDSDITILNICDRYMPPVADAGSDLVVKEGDTVALDASNSYTPDHHSLTYEWQQLAGPYVILSDALVPQPTFVAPEVGTNDTDLIFHLKVKDSHQLYGESKVSVFVKDNGVFATPPGTVSFLTYNNRRLFFATNNSTSLVELKPRDPEAISDSNNRPGNLIYGLMDIEIKVAKQGDPAYLTVHLPEPAPDGYRWFIWDEKNGWRDCGSYAIFNDARDQLTITLIDGGFGDADLTANGIIVDPSGLGSEPPESGNTVNSSDGNSGGGGGGCFINSLGM